jgi:hypothetical protein
MSVLCRLMVLFAAVQVCAGELVLTGPILSTIGLGGENDDGVMVVDGTETQLNNDPPPPVLQPLTNLSVPL